MADDSTNNISPVASWFPVTKDGWGLDVVTLLAVIGEGSMAEHAQPITASILCLLPRILPAPQALLKPTRPARLPDYPAKLAGVYSGVVLDSVGFFANIIHPLEDQAPHSFKVFEIRHAHESSAGGSETARKRSGSWASRWWNGGQGNASAEEKGGGLRGPPPSDADGAGEKDDKNGRATGNDVIFVMDVEKGNEAAASEPKPGIKRRVTDFMAHPTLKPTEPPAVPPSWNSPIHIVTVTSFIITLLIFGLTAYWRDGNALLAIFIISTQASLVGYASWWEPQLMVRPLDTTDVPAGDVVIRTRGGAFILVRCKEEVARELYAGADECKYSVGDRTYRFLMGVGTMMLMTGVVLLGNTKFNAQALMGGSYIVLNGAYWILGMLPKRYFWDLSRYVWEDVTPGDARNADKSTTRTDVERLSSFTRTLWFVIRETKQTGWVQRSGAAPQTPQWKQWLSEAGENAEKGIHDWPAVARKDEIMKEGQDKPVRPGESRTDAAEQHAPAQEIPLRSSPPKATGGLCERERVGRADEEGALGLHDGDADFWFQH